MDASRRALDVAELYLDGRATDEEAYTARYQAEGAALYLDSEYEHQLPDDPDEREHLLRYYAERRAHKARLAQEFAAIPPGELARLVLPTPEGDPAPRNLLYHAADFVEAMMLYPYQKRKENIEKYRRFLPVPLFREFVGNPFRVDTNSRIEKSV